MQNSLKMVVSTWISGYYSQMEKATISQIKNKLSAYLRRVRAGETVMIFDRNRPVARLERVEAGGHPEARLADLERAGLLKRHMRPLSLELFKTLPMRKDHNVLDALLEDRRTGR